MSQKQTKNDIVNFLFEQDLLISSDIINDLDNFDDNSLNVFFHKIKNYENISEDYIVKTFNEINDINKLRTQNSTQPNTTSNSNIKSNKKMGTVKIVDSYVDVNKKIEIQDFVKYYNLRLKELKSILMSRSELSGAISINRIISKEEGEEVVTIGLVNEKRITKNGHIILVLEDNTGSINVLVSKNNKDFYEQAKDIVEDEVIGVIGTTGNKIIFSNEIVWPDIPTNEYKKSPNDGYAVFLGDIHVGLYVFLEKEFLRMLKWLRQEEGSSKQKEIASKVKYIFILGDLVEGIGIYPGQEKELTIPDLFDQYKKFTEYMKMIPSHIQIIMIGGNHDAMRIAEPQPILDKKYAPELHEMENVHLVSNPAVVNIDSTDNFEGFDVLLYHGYSFPYISDMVQSIRDAGGMDRSDLIMEFLLKRRHLAPVHTGSLFLPNINRDPLVIKNVPDFFASGHLHKVKVSNYKTVTTIQSSCWVGPTEFQNKMGLIPEPAKVPVVNLKTREAKLMNFSEEK